MIAFEPITLKDKSVYESYLLDGNERGCEYTFANLYLWGRQQATILHNHMVIFSQFNNHSVYPYPIGYGDKKIVFDTIISDAKERGIPCQINGLYDAQKQTLEELYPGMFHFQYNRDSFDYVYAIDDLADLPGSKYHRKRNHFKRFKTAFPHYTAEPLSEHNLPQVKQMVENWYQTKLLENSEIDFHMEQSALAKALLHYRELGMEGLVILDGNEVLAVTLGSQMSHNTFDIHFEKARGDINGAYTAINYEFARHLRNKYPQIRFLNREDDMGLEGLRQAKQRYYPHHMVEKYWAYLLEDGYEY